MSHPAIALVLQQLLARLEFSPDYQTEFYVESLDSTSFADEASQQEVEKGLIRKYRNRKIDVVVAMGPASIRFLSGVSDTFLPEVPVIFCGSTEEQAGHPRLNTRFTGTWSTLEPAKTLDVAPELSPGTRHVVVVGGSSLFDKGVEAITRARLASYSARLDITYLTNLEMAAILERLGNLPRGSIVLYVSFFRDSAGNTFVNAATALPLVSQVASAPVFGMSDSYLRHGTVGGYVMSMSEQGRMAARIVLDILGGKKPQDIPIQRSPSVYMFDWRQLQRWGLSESKLPAGSIVLYRVPTQWERAKWILVASVLIILALACLAAYLFFNQNQVQRARNEQMRLSGMLIKAQEDERSRLASELHDDFSQRLAVLSLGLETVAEMVPESPHEAARQLHELMNSASEIGADLHTLSHRLHSYTLERLGLVPGVSAFCKEFAAQQEIEIDFSHENIPKSVSPEVSLCLFRVIQEGLRNVKKHSAASKAQVILNMVDGGLHLSVSDDGAGFDPEKLNEKPGLGFRSMAERARLIGARLEIRSEPQKGTCLDIWTQPQEQRGAEPAVQPVPRSAISG